MESVLSEIKLSNEKNKSFPIGLALGFIGIVILIVARIVYWLKPPLPVCMFKTLTGYPCPSCGTTRAIIDLSLFHFWDAILMDPLVCLVGLGVGIYAFYSGAVYFLDFPKLNFVWTKKRNNLARIIVVLAILLNWAYLIIMHR